MTVLVMDDHPSSDIDQEELRDWAEAALGAEGYPPDTEVSITLVTDDEMASRNERAFGRAEVTDVLAFPLEDLHPGVAAKPSPTGPPLLLGDVVIAPDYVRRQAHDLGVSVQDEMALMVTHAVLHLLGYDHATDPEAEVMEARECAILAGQGRTRR
ncbi:MAG TPA: rRNA maturation RNase YbeY [Acidimicrobiia bacterium]|jgi:probable rRNA maturation factor